MFAARCPHCSWPVVLPPSRLSTLFNCLNCRLTFDPQRAADPLLLTLVKAAEPSKHKEPPPQPPQPVGPLPRLTSAHRCANCEAPLPAVGVRRRTLDCPACHKRTDVFAVQYRCAQCDVELESPRASAGRAVSCPACLDLHTVPSDLLYNDDRAAPDETWFTFHCSSCRALHETPPAGARRVVVCPRCRLSCTVPPGGDAVPIRPAQPQAPEEVTESAFQQRCPNCQQSIPVGCRRCPVCQHGGG